MEGGSLGKKGDDLDFTQLIFSWSLDDVLNEDLYKNQVEKIPFTFQSEEHYLHSFKYPLLEETRAELASSMEIMYRAPYAEVFSIDEDIHKHKRKRKRKHSDELLYDVTIGTWRNRFSERGKEPYQTLPGDLLIFADRKPESVSDLQHVGRTWAFSLVKNIPDDGDEDDSTSFGFKVISSKRIEHQDGMFVVFLMNIMTQKRIWDSLHMNGNKNIIREVLHSDYMVKKNCDICCFDFDSRYFQNFDQNIWSMLNESQRWAIMASLYKTKCCHSSSVEQIWGPPGTGKTMTVSVLLFILLQMNRRMLTCAPTNVAVVQLASRVLRLVKESFKTRTESGASFYSIGDLLLFGNKKMLKVGSDIEEIYIDHRVKRLRECLGAFTGWKHCMRSMTDLLEDCVSQYHVFVENEKKLAKENPNETNTKKLQVKSFIEFLRNQFTSSALPLRRCIVTFCTHISRGFMTEYTFKNMVSLLDNLSSLQSLLFQNNLDSEELEQLFVSKSLEDDSLRSGNTSSINFVRFMAISVLKTLQISLEGLGLPSVRSKYAIMDFCFKSASLVFCTTSRSYKLHTVKMKPLDIMVIDEAAQLKEAESTIPLQLHGMKHAILIGDECQLPAMVTSNVSIESGFGRSLFERLSYLGHSKHLLNIQYRMHPSISFFPNRNFYQNQILDAENVLHRGYVKRYLSGPMFGSYSFINVVGGKEEKDDQGRSRRNMVEVALVIKIIQNLYKEWIESKKKLTIGVVSPYAAQVVSIRDKLAHKYEKLDGFSVKVRSIDGFQGGEEDIIILSTVRSNSHGFIGFMSSPQRTNVALTRARHCLWILGNERTLANSGSVWSEIVYDARNRCCLFNADADECLKMTIIDAKKELGHLDDLVNENSLLFTNEKWRVLFSDNFKRSFGKLMSSSLKKVVLNLLLRLSGGWRPKNRSVDLCCEDSSHVIKQFKVEGLYVIWTNEIIKDHKYLQVLKVWDILPFDEIPKLTKRLQNVFSAFTDDYISRCASKSMDGNLEVPRSWPALQEIIQFCSPSNCEGEDEASTNRGEHKNDVENSKVSETESLLLTKFYSLSSGLAKHLLAGKELDLPMEVTDEQMDIILSGKSSFIIGRPGTGKTTILTLKLYQNESEGNSQAESSSRVKDADVVDDPEKSKEYVLRQLFVTVSPRLCYAVKQHVSHLTSLSCNGNSSTEINLDDASDADDILDTFVDIPKKKYPLVITFHKFLMMLDATLGNSFFERFHEAREGSHGNHTSSRSVALRTFIRLKNVTIDRFRSHYWPNFDSNLTKKLDPSRVFTEIISHIKGGLKAGKLEDYSSLSESHSSTLSKQKRERVYALFVAYEKMKTERREFDLGDLVNDLHLRLKSRNYEGDQMDFVYIDEVQHLSMRQISLFKYICPNVDGGFTFAGDTAQTIADFRFEDIRSMFYTEFLSTRRTGTQEKGLVSEISQLKRNSRTHSGVLNLAQSVIDILYCYFVHSIDILEPETSLLSGEAPVLLESATDENAMMTIFGGTKTSGEMVGFGAEQVILVRDECVKRDIFDYIEKQALVLTIAECKGLEFQDVLLYNFFGTSPLKERWRVIYEYMKDQDWLDEELFHSFPSFSEARHNVLCSELKQLYVAITRTRQRLWICEDDEELSKPMFNYWKRRGLVQVRKLNDSAAQAMRVASSPQEWRERGKKLYYENNFVMATMCFERSGDAMWEKLAKARGLRASADRMPGTDPEAYSAHLREAAEMFESIGKLEPAALCYCDLGEYEKAGKIYIDKCGKINEAAECFTLAGCYRDAAEAYAKGDQISNCLSVCKKGRLFDEGMQYIGYWKEHVNVRNKETKHIEQEFLESCARDYHERQDPKSMMKFVRAFRSMESKRVLLRSLGCLDELLSLEAESGHFLEAAALARSWGDVLKEADLFEKAGKFSTATLLVVWYLFSNSSKQFARKEELCEKAKMLAKMDTRKLYPFVCSDLQVLSDQQSCLSELNSTLQSSRKHESLRGEMLLVKKILEAHLNSNPSKYVWEDELPIEIQKYCDDMMFQNRVSVRTLVFYWNRFKDNLVDVFESLGSLDIDEPNKRRRHIDFSLNYFGVRKQCINGNTVFLLVHKDADWLTSVDDNGGLRRDGKRLSIDGKQLVDAIESYWQSELLSVGMKVLEVLVKLHELSKKGSVFHQCTSLLHIFEVSKFLLDCKHLKLACPRTKTTLRSYLGISTSYFDLVFPLDWRRSVSEDLISLQKTDLSLSLLEDIILQDINIKGGLTYCTIGRVMMICLGYRKPEALYEKIITKLESKSSWKSFFEKFWGMNDVFARSLQHALDDTYNAEWEAPNYISPHSFVHLLDRLLFMASFSSGTFYTTKSCFVGWFTHIHLTCTKSRAASAPKQMLSDHTVTFLVGIVREILDCKEDTIQWIQRSDIVSSSYHPLLVLKLLIISSLICLHRSDCSKVVHELLLRFAPNLPKTFVSILLRRRRKGRSLKLTPDMVAEAFTSVEDPLVIVNTENESQKIHAPCAIFVDLWRSREEITNTLFPLPDDVGVGTTGEPSSSNMLPEAANHTVTSQELEIGEKEVSGSSDITAARQEDCYGGDSSAEVVVEEQSNTQDTKSKKGKGKARTIRLKWVKVRK